jgi:NAD(P)-dependent dehydrogenase (short-subunit alcohol dehydrogenase family)
MADASGAARLAGRVVIVTGGARGLGREIARAVRVSGGDVVMCGRDADTLAASARSLDPSGEYVVPVVCDVRDEQAVAELVATARERSAESTRWSTTAG